MEIPFNTPARFFRRSVLGYKCEKSMNKSTGANVTNPFVPYPTRERERERHDQCVLQQYIGIITDTDRQERCVSKQSMLLSKKGKQQTDLTKSDVLRPYSISSNKRTVFFFHHPRTRMNHQNHIFVPNIRQNPSPPIFQFINLSCGRTTL